MAAADECTKNCENNIDEGCDGRWKVGGEVVMCAEWSRYQIMYPLLCGVAMIILFRYGVRCLTSCELEGEKYTWCKTHYPPGYFG